MAALGPCSSAPSSFVVNEVTTIAAVYALNAFRTIPGSHANPLAVAGGRLTALSNALGACVRSSGGSAPCTRLFTDTNASDTLQAALFITNLTAAPTDWTISLNFINGFPGAPEAIAIDASGNVWSTAVTRSASSLVPAKSYLVGLSPTGIPMTAPSGANNGVTEFIGATAPTLTPLVAQIVNHVQRAPPSPPPLTTYSIGGSLSGLASGASVVLQDNGGDNLPVSANGSFAFATAIASGAAYAVTVLTQPTGQTCVVSAGSGTVGAADITSSDALAVRANGSGTIGAAIVPNVVVTCQ